MENNSQIHEMEAEIKRLKMELEETNAILDLREEELKASKRNDESVSELYSLLSDKDIEVESLKQKILKNQRKAEAAINFQEELLGDLDELKTLKQENSRLQAQIAELQSDAENYELQMLRMQKKAETAAEQQVSRLQIELETLQLENLRLKKKITMLEAGDK